MTGQNPLCELARLGQSIWLDFLRRDLFQSGQLQQLIDNDCLKGVTSNPTIFEKGITGTGDYDGDIEAMAEQGKSVEEIYTALTVGDIRAAADVLRPTWQRLHHADGYVSLEVNPHLAHQTEQTVAEANSLWELVDRPNIFIKIPATEPGLQAIRQAVAAGINVNVTLLFSLERYVEVVEAYLSGLEDRAGAGQPIDDIRSVASFFLSRVDVLLDPKLDEIGRAGGERGQLAQHLRGQVAIASARQAYRLWQELFSSPRFRALRECGGHVQRLLWASTSTKDPTHPDLKYVEPLIAPTTVNTLPLETIKAYRDHGEPQVRIHDEPEWTRQVLSRLPELGLSLDKVTQQLEQEGVEKFSTSYDKLLAALQDKQNQIVASQPAQTS